MEEVFTHTEAEMGISFPWQTSVISEQNTVAGHFPKINSLFASTIKSPQTIVYAPRFGNRWLNLMHFHLSAWH